MPNIKSLVRTTLERVADSNHEKVGISSRAWNGHTVHAHGRIGLVAHCAVGTIDGGLVSEVLGHAQGVASSFVLRGLCPIFGHGVHTMQVHTTLQRNPNRVDAGSRFHVRCG